MRLIPGIIAVGACVGAIAAGCSGKTAASDRDTALEWDTTAQHNIKIHMETQRFGNGYGYVIAVNGKKIIEQDMIPIIEGIHQFQTPKDAYNIGITASRQMAEGMGMPYISREVLMMYGILDKNGVARTAPDNNEQ